jgi:hypothetical protein
MLQVGATGIQEEEEEMLTTGKCCRVQGSRKWTVIDKMVHLLHGRQTFT